LAKNQAYAAKRLVALYKINQLGWVHILASAETMYEFFQRETTLEKILAFDKFIMETIARDKSEKEHFLTALKQQETAKLNIEDALKNQMEKMNQKRSQRDSVLAQIRSKKSLQMAALNALEMAEKQLENKIKTIRQQVVQSEPSFQLPTKPFAELKGLLKIPVAGKVVNKFGPYINRQFNITNFRSGIDIQAERGEPIRSVCLGRVIYADWFKGYGNMIIIDHGGSYYTVYANIEELFKSAGDEVQTGEVVATVGDTGSKIGPKLHFEIRHHGKPIDPLTWVGNG
jgi:murein hydrolase activator